MALTVSQTPQLYTPAYNAQIFRALSNQIAVADFKYIVTVQVNGGTVFTYDILQRPDGYVIYDPIEIVKNYITRDYFNPELYLSGSYALATGKAATVEVKIKEYYTAAIQSTYTYNYTVWDACLKEDDFSTFNYQTYLGNLTTGIVPLRDVDNPYPTLNTQSSNYFMHFFRGTATKVTLSLVSGFSVLDTFDIALNTGNNLIHYIDCGYQSWVALGAISPSDGDELLIEIKNGSTVLYTESIFFKEECTKYDKLGLFYLTRAGKVNFMDFNFISQTSINKKSNDVRLNPNKNGASSYGSNIWTAEKFIVSTQTTKQILLNSDWITQYGSVLLEQLFDSPVVYIKDYVLNKFHSVTINDNSYSIKKTASDKIFNYSVSVEYGTQETRQRGL
jgi:hypothetical protein